MGKEGQTSSLQYIKSSSVLLFSTVVFACGGRAEVRTDGSVDAFSWDDLPDVNVDGYIVPWEGPLPVKVFRQETLWDWQIRPIIVPDDQGGAIIVAPDKMGCESMYSGCVALFAQRLSPEGDRLWGDSGIQISDYEDITFAGACGNWGNDCLVLSDSSGGFFLFLSDYDENGQDISIYANHVSSDGIKLADSPLRIELPREDLIGLNGGESIILYPNIFPYYLNGLLYVSVYNAYSIITGKVFLAILDENLNIQSFPFLSNGILFGSWLFKVSDDEFASIIGTYETEDTAFIDLKFLDPDGNISSESLLPSIGEFPSDASGTDIFRYDEKANRVFWACGSMRNEKCPNSYIFCMEINKQEHTYRNILTVDAKNTAHVENIVAIKGDEGGGLYVSGANYTIGGECEDMDCCSIHPDMCWTDLVVQWIDRNGEVMDRTGPAVLETYSGSGWEPISVFVNSNIGSVIHIWKRPLINQDAAIPDVLAFWRGFYLCAQRHESDSFSVWPQQPCLDVAQIFTEHEEERWFDAVTDGEGGAIVVFYESGYGIWAQRLSADGRILWDGRNEP